MDFYEQPLGRGLEIVVGIILLFIALVFTALICLIVSNFPWSYTVVLGTVILGFCSFWFGKLGYRLVFNKPRNGGGLLSNNGLKFGCIFFGVSSIILCMLSITQQDLVTALCGLSMLVACLFGWQVAKKRSSKNT